MPTTQARSGTNRRSIRRRTNATSVSGVPTAVPSPAPPRSRSHPRKRASSRNRCRGAKSSGTTSTTRPRRPWYGCTANAGVLRGRSPLNGWHGRCSSEVSCCSRAAIGRSTASIASSPRTTAMRCASARRLDGDDRWTAVAAARRLLARDGLLVIDGVYVPPQDEATASMPAGLVRERAIAPNTRLREVWRGAGEHRYDARYEYLHDGEAPVVAEARLRAWHCGEDALRECGTRIAGALDERDFDPWGSRLVAVVPGWSRGYTNPWCGGIR